MEPLAFQSDGLPTSGIAERKITPADVVVGELWGQKALILAALIAAPRTVEDLMRIVYGAAGREAPPRHGQKSMHIAISHLRDRLRPGWTIGNLPAGRHGFSRVPQRYVLRRA